MIALIDVSSVKSWNNNKTGQLHAPLHIDIGCPNPACGHSFVNRALTWSTLSQNVGVSRFRCMSCETDVRIFIIDAPTNADSEAQGKATLVILPPLTAQVEYSRRIRELSPEFVSLSLQAIEAEMHGLNKITGMAYRKAVEFLIKDYLIEKEPERAEEIRNKFLGNCIRDHVDNINVKECVQRTVWLGNDETHFVRKWEDRDIYDLKSLIALTVHWLEMELLSEEYTNEMQK